MGTLHAGQQAASINTLRTEIEQMKSVHDAELDTSRRRFNTITAESEAAVALARTESETDAAQAAAYLIEQMNTQRSANSDARSAESSMRHAAQRGIMLQHMDTAEKENKRLEAIISTMQETMDYSKRRNHHGRGK